MRIALFATSLQLADNLLPVLELNIARGGESYLLLMPWTGYPAHSGFNPSNVPVLAKQPISSLSEQGVSVDRFESFIEEYLPADIDVIFLAHGHSYPSRILRRTLQRLGRRTTVSIMQHGIYQDWAARSEEASFDYYFCFGERDRYQFSPDLRPRVIPVGFPRLDLMRKTRARAGRYILYVGQDVPEPWIVSEVLEQCRQYFDRPVVVRPHPRFAETYARLPNEVEALPEGVAVDGPLIPLIANADFIITAHSTAVIEALYLQKPAILIPNHGLTCFSQYPAIAKDFSAVAISEALSAFNANPERVQRFLEDAVGGIRYDHSERCRQALFDRMLPQRW